MERRLIHEGKDADHLGRRVNPFAILLGLAAVSGCSTMARKHEANRIPQYGVIDPHQPRELHKSPYPPYVIEPPDELEIAIRPPLPDGARRPSSSRPTGSSTSASPGMSSWPA